MADLSLVDALTEPPPEIEGEIKRDFIATLEAEPYDDTVGETVEKTEYIPLMDGDEKAGNPESTKKPCSDTSPVEGKCSGEGDARTCLECRLEVRTCLSPLKFGVG